MFQAFIIAFTSDFIPHLVYTLSVSSDYSLKGFLNHSLAYLDEKDLDLTFPPASSLKYCRWNYDEIKFLNRIYTCFHKLSSKKYWKVKGLATKLYFKAHIFFLYPPSSTFNSKWLYLIFIFYDLIKFKYTYISQHISFRIMVCN